MHKYKYFILFFSGIALLLLMIYFPVSFDNNDDQAMFFINSGVLSGVPTPTIIHTNLLIGIILKELFSFSSHINWYTLYLQVVQALALLTIYFIIIYDDKMNLIMSAIMLTFLLLGFSALCIVKVQYTIVALLSCSAALFCIQSELPKKTRYLLSLFFVVLMMLVRKDSFYLFIAFNIPILFLKRIKNETDKSYLLVLAMAVVLFFGLKFINENNTDYKKWETYKYLNVLDDVIDKPVKYTTADLESHHFTQDDMTLLSARYPAGNNYSSGNDILELAEKIKVKRSTTALITELKKFISDERYMLLVYLLSIMIVLIYAPKSISIMLLNGIVFCSLLLYLGTTIRIPHRVTFPLLIYVSAVNIYVFSKETNTDIKKLWVLSVFVLLGFYKFYCTCKLIQLHKQYHTQFAAYEHEITTHPDYLFISLHDGLPVEYMNAWQPPYNLFTSHNLIMTGWNVWVPDFQNTLKRHGLIDISADLKHKQNVFFLTESETYQKAFIHVMEQRYKLTCHFEAIQEDFKVLHPRKLIFDN